MNQETPNSKHGLKRSLGLWELVFFGVGSILGAGIYALIGKVVGESGYMAWLSFLLAVFTALLSVFAYAELSSMFPEAGGEYVYALKALGKVFSVFVGLMVALSTIITAATVSLGFAGYFSQLAGVPEWITAGGIILLIFAVNAIGVKLTSFVNIIFTLIEIGGLVLIVVVARNHFGNVDYTQLPKTGMHGLLTGAALSFFALLGMEKIVKLAEETRKPEKRVPQALFLSSAIVAIIYVLVAIAAVSVLKPDELSSSDHPLSDIVKTEFGKTGAIVIAIIALFSTSNTILSDILASSRILLNMGEDISWLRWFSKVWKRRRTPLNALVVVMLVTILFSLVGEIKTVALLATFSVFLTFLLVNIAAIILRMKLPDEKRPFRIPVRIGKVPLIPVLAVISTLILMGYTVYSLVNVGMY